MAAPPRPSEAASATRGGSALHSPSQQPFHGEPPNRPICRARLIPSSPDQPISAAPDRPIPIATSARLVDRPQIRNLETSPKLFVQVCLSPPLPRPPAQVNDYTCAHSGLVTPISHPFAAARAPIERAGDTAAPGWSPDRRPFASQENPLPWPLACRVGARPIQCIDRPSAFHPRIPRFSGRGKSDGNPRPCAARRSEPRRALARPRPSPRASSRRCPAPPARSPAPRRHRVARADRWANRAQRAERPPRGARLWKRYRPSVNEERARAHQPHRPLAEARGEVDWRELRPVERIEPASAERAERALFVTDVARRCGEDDDLGHDRKRRRRLRGRDDAKAVVGVAAARRAAVARRRAPVLRVLEPRTARTDRGSRGISRCKLRCPA